MRKEILLAIFVGMSLGLMITFGIYQGRQNSTTKQNTDSNRAIINPVSSDSATLHKDAAELVVNSPEPNLLSKEAEIIVSGMSNPDSFIIIFVNDQEYITNADEAGNFSSKVKLEEGGNLLTVTSLDEDGRQVEKQLSVIYEK
jgi:hypothetical protein